ncbi:MAG: PilZ domain-containing protein [Spirochaetales bacterium]|nr:PilZ domain-containing protein [Spirochaetales bacterium]
MDEKRKYDRAPLTTLIDYHGVVEAEAKNISEGGLCLTSKFPFSVGTPLFLAVLLPEVGTLNIIGKIIRCHTIKQETYECGVKFVSLLLVDRQKIQKYVYDRLKDESDRRNNPRIEIDLYVDYSVPIRTGVKNYNSEGLCIITHEQFRKDNIILLIFTVNDNKKLCVYGKVIWSKRLSGDIYETGIKFWEMNKHDLNTLLEYFHLNNVEQTNELR